MAKICFITDARGSPYRIDISDKALDDADEARRNMEEIRFHGELHVTDGVNARNLETGDSDSKFYDSEFYICAIKDKHGVRTDLYAFGYELLPESVIDTPRSLEYIPEIYVSDSFMRKKVMHKLNLSEEDRRLIERVLQTRP